MQTVLKLAENILAAPTDPDVRRFKMSNNTIKKLIIEPKGVLQLVVDVRLILLSFVFPADCARM